ncbi:MAG: recombination mediator RecR [Candidatus Sericytochromatia bacterium]|nr:recombination mediator RecR [Candidatus Sericytochromatia bacterium]
MPLPGPLQDLVAELQRLPGIGHKSAQRLGLHLAGQPVEAIERLASVLVSARRSLMRCSTCHDLSDAELCRICGDPGRDVGLMAVVSGTREVLALERTREFKGRYHVLGGLLSPLDGIGPDQLNVRSLLERLRAPAIREVLLALEPTVEGEATTLYLSRLLRPLGIPCTRLASGLSVGADLDIVDEVTLARAFEGRRPID